MREGRGREGGKEGAGGNEGVLTYFSLFPNRQPRKGVWEGCGVNGAPPDVTQ